MEIAEIVDDVAIAAPPVAALESITRAEFDVQISTAQRYPKHSDARGIQRFHTQGIMMATIDQETAESCMYALPRDGRTINGMSVRLAEIAVACYGNIRAGARVIEITDKEIVAQGVCHDLENNVYQSTEVRRRITDSKGRRYKDDMVITTCNAACSIAFRNAAFKVIPRALVEPIHNAAKNKATGGAATIDIRRAKCINQFTLIGVRPEQITAYLKVAAISEITSDHLADLIGIFNAIKLGEADADSVFPQIDKPEAAGKTKSEKLASKLKPTEVPSGVTEEDPANA